MPCLISPAGRPRIAVLAAPSLPLWPRGRLLSAIRAVPLAEQRYVMRFRSRAQKQARCIARLLLIQAADLLGLPATLRTLRRDARGRPSTAESGFDVSFSHAPGLTVCAIGLGCRVGVDVEPRRDLPYEEIAPALSAPEKERVQSGHLPGSLLSCWTVKEAVLKGDGRGFSSGLEGCDLFSPEPVLGGQRWYVSRHVFEKQAVTYLCALAADVPTAVIETVPS